MNLSAMAQSIKSKLGAIAKKHGKAYYHIEMSFLLERLVARLLDHPELKKEIVFKGGFVGLRVYHTNRYTTDVDVELNNSNVEKNKIIQAIESDLGDAVWFALEREENLSMQDEVGGTRLSFRSGIGDKPGSLYRCRIIHFDICHSHVEPAHIVDASIQHLLDDQRLSLLVCSVECMAAEKLHAMVSLAGYNSRSKDIFDLIYLLPQAKTNELKKSLNRCFQARGTQLPKSISSFVNALDTRLLNRGWHSATNSVPQAPSFNEAMRQLVTALRNHGL